MKPTITYHNGRYYELKPLSGPPPNNGDMPAGEVPYDLIGGGDLTFETPKQNRGDDNHADPSSELYVY